MTCGVLMDPWWVCCKNCPVDVMPPMVESFVQLVRHFGDTLELKRRAEREERQLRKGEA